jgi:lysozyme
MTRCTNAAGVAIIREFEGCKLKAYRCPANRWTCGYGETENVGPTTVWTQEEADRRLALRLRRTEAAVEKMLLGTRVSDNQFSALVSLTYNIGETAFAKSTLLRKLRAGDTLGAFSEFPRWAHANGQLLSGLVRRRRAEQELFASR